MNAAFMISLSVPLVFIALFFLEPRLSARSYEVVHRWRVLGSVFFVLALILGSLVPMIFEALGLTLVHLFDLSSAGWWAFPLGFFATCVINYLWHRAMHASNFLWRTVHQLHHSPKRVDVAGAFFAHPFEVIAKTSVGIFTTVMLLGLAPQVASAVTSFVVVLSVFQHFNIRTPRFLGAFIPRPEMHALHHESNVHARNYSELPLLDWLFGTYQNPESFSGEVGFEAKASGRIKEMLLMKDVTKA